MDTVADTVKAECAEPVVVFFDGVCNLCNGTVDFIIERDEAGYFHFASLQSDFARATLPPADVAGEPSSIVLREEGALYRRSTAALRIARRLGGPWSLIYALIVVPAPIRDLAYRLIATYRYRWFGKAEVCRVPTAELQARFIE